MEFSQIDRKQRDVTQTQHWPNKHYCEYSPVMRGLILILLLAACASTDYRGTRAPESGSRSECTGQDCAWLAVVGILSGEIWPSATEQRSNSNYKTRQPLIEVDCSLINRDTQVSRDCQELDAVVIDVSSGREWKTKLKGPPFVMPVESAKERYELRLKVGSCQRSIHGAQGGERFKIRFGVDCARLTDF